MRLQLLRAEDIFEARTRRLVLPPPEDEGIFDTRGTRRSQFPLKDEHVAPDNSGSSPRSLNSSWTTRSAFKRPRLMGPAAAQRAGLSERLSGRVEPKPIGS